MVGVQVPVCRWGRGSWGRCAAIGLRPQVGRAARLEFQPQMGCLSGYCHLGGREDKGQGASGAGPAAPQLVGAGQPKVCPATQNPGQLLGRLRLGVFLWSLPLQPHLGSFSPPPPPSLLALVQAFTSLKKSLRSHDPSESPGRGWQSHGQGRAPTGRRPGEGGRYSSGKADSLEPSRSSAPG